MTRRETPFWLNDLQVVPDANQLKLDGQKIRLPPRLMKLLCVLAGTGGETLRREALQGELWPRGFVNDEALSRAVAELRHFLGDNARQPVFIETVPKRGYRLLVPVSEQPPAEETARPGTQKSRPAWHWLVAATSVIVVAYALMQLFPSSPPQITLNPALLASAERLTSEHGIKFHPELSNDGQWLAYLRGVTGSNTLVVIPTARPIEQRVVEFPTMGWSPVFSPDPGTMALVSIESGACQIKQLSLATETTSPLGACQYPNEAPILDWSADGHWLAFVDTDEETGSAAIWQMSLADGERRQLTYPPDAYTFDTRPRFSPDGRQLTFTRGTNAFRELWVQSLDENDAIARQLSFDHQYIKSHDWLADGQTVVLDSERSGYRALWQLGLDGQWTLLGARDAQSPSLAGNRLAFRIAQFEANIWRIDIPDVTAVTAPLIASTKYDSNPAFSPDGLELAFSSNRTGTGAIWLAAADGSRQRIAYEPAQGRVVWPNWSPDGKHLIATRYSNRGQALVTIALDKLEVNVLPTGGVRPYGGTWSADGEWIYYVASHGKAGTRLWRQKADGSGSPEVVLDLPVNRFATDDEWIYYTLHAEDGLFRIPLTAENVALASSVLPDLPQRFSGSWLLHKGWLYFPELRDNLPARLVRMRGDGSELEEVTESIATALGPNLAIHPSGEYLLMSRTDRVESDIFLSDLGDQKND